MAETTPRILRPPAPAAFKRVNVVAQGSTFVLAIECDSKAAAQRMVDDTIRDIRTKGQCGFWFEGASAPLILPGMGRA